MNGSSHSRGVHPLLAVLILGLGMATAASPLAGQATDQFQREIQESQRRLEQIREERARLQQEMQSIRQRVQNVSGELLNIERQLAASRSVLAEVEFQFETASRQVEFTTADLLTTRDQLRERQAILNRRLRDIYKRGALHTARVLLGADSFSELLHRYRYLQVIATYDRALVENVRRLEAELTSQSQDLQQSMTELDRLREAQLAEVAQLRAVESTHQRTLQQFRTQEGQATSRLDALEEDERRLTNAVADLERRRLEEERRLAISGAPAAGPSTLSTADIGVLDWPVQGSIVYNFGPERRSNGTVLRWNGVGIRAPVGTPVRAVRGGTVELAGSFDGYGPSVIVGHGGGYYTLYLYLEEIGVVQGRRIETGQVVGTVGGAGTPEGARLEFQIRAPVNGSPQAMDPLRWLRPR